jgi:hypothetical protein
VLLAWPQLVLLPDSVACASSAAAQYCRANLKLLLPIASGCLSDRAQSETAFFRAPPGRKREGVATSLRTMTKPVVIVFSSDVSDSSARVQFATGLLHACSEALARSALARPAVWSSCATLRACARAREHLGGRHRREWATSHRRGGSRHCRSRGAHSRPVSPSQRDPARHRLFLRAEPSNARWRGRARVGRNDRSRCGAAAHVRS